MAATDGQPMVTCSAPGKIILFGEHAVVFGEPALAVAINLRTITRADPAKDWSVNGLPLQDPHCKYIRNAVARSGTIGPLGLSVQSTIPEGSGMGSSAAVTVATLGALHVSSHPAEPGLIASEAFDVEHNVQGRASPIDTSTSTHGHAVLVLKKRGSGFLWQLQKGDRQWFLHHRDVPPMTFVVGNTGLEAATGPLVEKVRAFCEKNNEGRKMIAEIGQITLDGTEAIREKDWAAVGSLMDRNHRLLNALGVGHEKLDRLVAAARPFSYGAKLTGAGGGGSMIALTDKPDEAALAIESAGGRAFKILTGQRGMEVLS
jgi:mevalonate kinase